MARPKVLVLRAPGINCEQEACHAWQLAGATFDLWHLNRLIDQPAALDAFDILTLPGGFSYGDDLSGGRIFANRLMAYLSDALRAFVDRGRLVLGICNGFQILAKAGLLDAGEQHRPCTLAFNDSGRFTCRWVTLECTNSRCVFLEPNRRYFLPIAHAEGRVAVAGEAPIDEQCIALKYAAGNPRVGSVNPNGSVGDVAALTDATGRILGMMPHPERFVDRTQHPFWTSLGEDCEPDGLAIFQAAVRRFQ